MKPGEQVVHFDDVCGAICAECGGEVAVRLGRAFVTPQPCTLHPRADLYLLRERHGRAVVAR